MSKFKVGDKVVRVKALNLKGLKTLIGEEVIVKEVHCHNLFSTTTGLNHYIDEFELVNKYPNPPHKHADLIKAWADGAEIQYFSEALKVWCDCDNRNIVWGETIAYRIKSDNQDKIAEIEQEMRELADKQTKLADKLSKLKS